MKFARYLEDTQTPEWKKVYIDYRGLKKRITAIRRQQESLASLTQSLNSSASVNTHPYLPRQSQEVQSPTEDFPTNSSFSVVQPSQIESIPGDGTEPTPTPNRPRGLSFRHSIKNARRPSFIGSGLNNLRRNTWLGRATTIRRSNEVLPLSELMTRLIPVELEFFTMLDAELEKVETFYATREKELSLRTRVLQQQLQELRDHKKLVEAVKKKPWTSALTDSIKQTLRSSSSSENPLLRIRTNASTATTQVHTRSTSPDNEKVSDGHKGPPVDLDTYLNAKKKLKKAVLEHYRGLELLHNFRILNLTGFRKALKKFEKITKIPVQQQYTTEKLNAGLLGSDDGTQEMRKEMQDLYAAAFVRGDAKKAAQRLRGGSRNKTHHFSTFRSGVFLGLAVPALASGIYHSSLPSTHETMQAWDGLLLIYGVILVPVLFSFLLGMNLLVWARTRINYSFIFELDVRTRMDYREYFEIPTFLLTTLSYAFWFSFAGIGSPHVSPAIWPLVWLALTGVVLFNPLPMLFRPSRFWLLRNLGAQLLSGTRRVEFADFWMGDQLCSLVYTLSNLFQFACIYAEGFREDWTRCGASSFHWPIAFACAIIPLLIRLIQSIRRYADSGLPTHLINGGKYGVGIISSLFYYMWRHNSNSRALMVMWLLFNTASAIYSCTWDLLMDWSLLRPHAKHFFLRDELGYPDHVPLYYFAILSNIVIRFAWTWYIPRSGPSMHLRTFTVGLLEMLRRVQWNFFRLENEHLGNIDQYRVTREVPLPYSFDDHSQEHDDDSDDESPATPRSE